MEKIQTVRSTTVIALMTKNLASALSEDVQVQAQAAKNTVLVLVLVRWELGVMRMVVLKAA